jgi:hypothetical protein
MVRAVATCDRHCCYLGPPPLLHAATAVATQPPSLLQAVLQARRESSSSPSTASSPAAAACVPLEDIDAYSFCKLRGGVGADRQRGSCRRPAGFRAELRRACGVQGEATPAPTVLVELHGRGQQSFIYPSPRFLFSVSSPFESTCVRRWDARLAKEIKRLSRTPSDGAQGGGSGDSIPHGTSNSPS